MDQFVIFNLGNRKALLDKHKEQKIRNEREIRTGKNIIKVQTHIRRWLCCHKYAGADYPLLINIGNVSRHISLVHNFWSVESNSPDCLLTQRMATLGLECILKGVAPNSCGTWNLLQNLAARQCPALINREDYQAVFLELLERSDVTRLHKLAEHSQFMKGLKSSKRVASFFILLSKITSQPGCEGFLMKLCANLAEIQVQRSQIVNVQRWNYGTLRASFQYVVRVAKRTIRQGDIRNSCNLAVGLSLLLPSLKQSFIDYILQEMNVTHELYGNMRQEVLEAIEDQPQTKIFEAQVGEAIELLPLIIPQAFEEQNPKFNLQLLIVEVLSNSKSGAKSIKITEKAVMQLFKMIPGHFSQQISKQLHIQGVMMLLERVVSRYTDKQFFKCFKDDPEKLLSLMKNHLIFFLEHFPYATQNKISLQIVRCANSLLADLYNKVFRTKIVPISVFSNIRLAKKLQLGLENSQQGNLSSSYLLFPLQLKYQLFQIKRRESMNRYGHVDFVKIRRGRQFQDAFSELRKSDLRNRLRVTFVDQFDRTEQGMDAGGLTKEFLNRVLKNALDPTFKMFTQNKQNELYPSPQKADLREAIIAEQYQFIGKLLGKSIMQNIMLGCKFSGPFLNVLIGRQNSFDELQNIDSEIYSSLCIIKAMEEGVENMELTFQYQDNTRGKLINLRPNGSKVLVTNENKQEYLYALADYKVNTLMKRQSKFIRKGMLQSLDVDCLSMFNYDELNCIISGRGTIDIADLQRYTQLFDYSPRDQTIVDFWAVVSSFTEEDKALLLNFVTACPRPSFFGFKELSPPFSIRRLNSEGARDMLPMSHTCGNIMDLPDYLDREVLRTKLLIAIRSNSGFEMR